MLITKQKREPRRARQHTAWLTFDDDFVSHECQVLDVSLNGAKLVAEIGVTIEAGLDFRPYRMRLYVSNAKSSGAAAKCSALSL
jgi:hypothetical protein